MRLTGLTGGPSGGPSGGPPGGSAIDDVYFPTDGEGPDLVEVSETLGLPNTSSLTNALLPITFNGVPLPVVRPVGMRSLAVQGSEITDTFTTSVPVVIHVIGHVKGLYNIPGIPVNAGVKTAVAIDGVTCASSFSFEGESVSINFPVNASCIQRLNPGAHTIRVLDIVAGAYPGMNGYTAKLQYEVLPAPESGLVTPVLKAESVSASGSSVSASISYPFPVLVKMAGYIRGTYIHPSSGVGNAGVRGALSVNGQECSSFLSFEGETNSATFDSSPSCIVSLPAGTHTLRAADTSAGFYPHMSGRYVSLQYEVLLKPSPGLPLVYGGEKVVNESSLVSQVTVSHPIVVSLAGHVRGTYNVPTVVRNAGVWASIRVNGSECGSSFSFEGESASVGFDANAACIQLLLPGTHTIEVRDATAGSYPNVTGYLTRLQWAALAAPEPGF